jgi:rhodanese-related sulfurtransferase
MRMGRSLLELIKRLRGSFLDRGKRTQAPPRSRRSRTVVDVRGPDEFIGPLGHIATARNIPVGELESRLAELAGFERKSIVLVCRTDKRLATAALTLRAAGFKQVNVLRRGMERWNDANLPVEC